ncbi:SDR family NAD(P)-dependent oxidoreductase [Hymenobacter busanensis]|uniref:SDR family NAD(P)-dependent oxidoreductase n=1 Tax=Hymenobacter busanensis TaxID=2607656 RepID=A0A7L5A268_9BACT|nr:SDR family NAD(P)-dependent oxidoreductase [Hymenobacter busanensis]KAA9338313.1 SDR family NAD(P)-dependent oxidoreductase [Hymenobacter busanensis]QHJ09263.1 SDR family NAD(P)-dependent oxidoreductase [Hymenobacter busanensis]
MHYYIITGASRGLGKALAATLLAQPDTHVLGVSRHATIEHPRYQHQPLDLSDIVAVENNLFKIFPARPDAQSLTLINNAGVVGEIGYIGEQPNEHYEFVFDVNVVAPAMLMNTFLSAYSGLAVPRTVLNISSGAAQRPVDGWGAYCASKAALDMLSQVAQHEQDLRGRGARIRSLVPGVIDTDMQAQIRTADEQQFSQAKHFNALHQENQLADAQAVAAKIQQWLTRPPHQAESVVLRIGDL